MNPLSGLTERHLEVALWVSQGLKNQEIGQVMKISVYTVKRHLQEIFARLKVNNRTELAMIYVKNCGNREKGAA